MIFGLSLASSLDIYVFCYTDILHIWIDPESFLHTDPKVSAWRVVLGQNDLFMLGSSSFHW